MAVPTATASILSYIFIQANWKLPTADVRLYFDPGDCAFMRRDNRMWLQKRVKDGRPYRSVVMKFSRDYLKEFFHTLNRKDIPADARREKRSLVKFPTNRLDVRSLFESLVPYFDAGVSPDEDILKMKMAEGMFAILKTDENLYASLFDFVEPWKRVRADIFLTHRYSLA